MRNKVLEAKLTRLGVLDKFLANTDFEEDPYLDVIGAFDWHDSLEGHKFWLNIEKKCEKILANKELEAKLSKRAILDNFIINASESALYNPDVSIYTAFAWSKTKEGADFWSFMAGLINEK